jgi:hypothetical protein
MAAFGAKPSFTRMSVPGGEERTCQSGRLRSPFDPERALAEDFMGHPIIASDERRVPPTSTRKWPGRGPPGFFNVVERWADAERHGPHSSCLVAAGMGRTVLKREQTNRRVSNALNFYNDRFHLHFRIPCAGENPKLRGFQ